MVVMAGNADDRRLVEEFNRGDESAFDTIVRQYSAEIALLANRLLGWPGDVEDVTQETFLAAFLGLKKFRCQCSLKTWLFTITINKCRTYRYRRMLRLQRLPRSADKPLLNSRRTAQTALMDSETLEKVRRAVRALPPRYREPVVLKYLQMLPTSRIAQMLGISNNALQVRLNRARKKLKPHLAELIEEDR